MSFMGEVLILLAVTILFATVFLITFFVFSNIIIKFVLGQVKKIMRDRNVIITFFSFVKVFIVTFVCSSSFIYSMSFILRIENTAFKQRESIKTAETRIFSEKEPPLARKEGSEPPLFDFVIQAAVEQNAKKQLNFILTSGAAFALVAVVAAGGRLVYLAKHEPR